MLRMVRSCDRTQRKLAIFLIVVIVTEIYLICRIVEHEHHTAHAEQGHLVKKGARLSSDQEGSRSMIPKRKHSLAEVFTERNSTAQYPWLSTNSRDHCNYGDAVRRQAYEQFKQAYKQIEYQNRDVMVGNSLIHDIHPSSMVTSHELDFRDYKIPAPSIPQQNEIIKNAPKVPESTGMKYRTTAQQAYGWPKPFKQVRFTLGS